MIFFRPLILVVISLAMLSCALPSEGPLQHFRDSEELSTVQIAREGLSYLSQNRFAEAEMRFRQALFREPDLDNLKRNLSAALEGREDFEEAEKILLGIASGKDKDEVDTLFRLAHIKTSKGDLVEADRIYRSLFDRAVNERDFGVALKALRNLKTLAFKTGREEDAACFAEAIFALDQGIDALIEWAKMLTALGRFDQVVGILDLYPPLHGYQRDPRIMHFQAIGYFALHDLKRAWELEERVVRGGKIDSVLLREVDLVRILSAADPDVAASLSEETLEALNDSWNEIVDSFDLSNRDFLTLPAPLLDEYLAKINRNG